MILIAVLAGVIGLTLIGLVSRALIDGKLES